MSEKGSYLCNNNIYKYYKYKDFEKTEAPLTH